MSRGLVIVWVAALVLIALTQFDITLSTHPWIHFVYWPIVGFGLWLTLMNRRIV